MALAFLFHSAGESQEDTVLYLARGSEDFLYGMKERKS